MEMCNVRAFALAIVVGLFVSACSPDDEDTLPSQLTSPTIAVPGDSLDSSEVTSVEQPMIVGDEDWDDLRLHTSGSDPAYPHAETVGTSVASLTISTTSGPFGCSGSLIGRNTILTAEHCRRGGTSSPLTIVSITATFGLKMNSDGTFPVTDTYTCSNIVDVSNYHDAMILSCAPKSDGTLPGDRWPQALLDSEEPLSGRELFAVSINCKVSEGGPSSCAAPVRLLFSPGNPSDQSQIRKDKCEVDDSDYDRWSTDSLEWRNGFTHNCDTENGSSGGAVFTRSGGRQVGIISGNNVINNHAGSTTRYLSGRDADGDAWVDAVENLVTTAYGDFDGDGRLDRLGAFRSTPGATSRTWVIDYAASGVSNAVISSNNFCGHAEGVLYVGDFNDDGKDDVMCYQQSNGSFWFDFNSGNSFQGVNDEYYLGTNFCAHGNGAKVFVGDYDGDGKDDLLCHDSTGKMWLDFGHVGPTGSVSKINGSNDWYNLGSTFCDGTGTLIVGNFSGLGAAELACHRKALTANVAIDWWSGTLGSTTAAGFGTADFVNNAPTAAWCGHFGAVPFAGNFDGSGWDDLGCHDTSSGSIWVDLHGGTSGANSYFRSQNDIYSMPQLCKGRNNAALVAGRLDSDWYADIACDDPVGDHFEAIRLVDF